MTDSNVGRRRDPLTRSERAAAFVAALGLCVAGGWLIVDPPDRTVALSSCQSAAEGCVVRVDGDMSTIAGAILALAAGAGLIAIFGVRFTSVKAGAFELNFEAETAGLSMAEPLPSSGEDEPPSEVGSSEVAGPQEASPVRVDVLTGLGNVVGVTPVPIVSLESPMNTSQARFLRDYQTALRNRHKGWFLTHILGPAKTSGQKYSIAIKVTPHARRATDEVVAVRFFFGRAWGHEVFEGSRGADGEFGITTEAYGEFLALCEVDFKSGDRVLLDHYCDFEMGTLVEDGSSRGGMRWW